MKVQFKYHEKNKDLYAFFPNEVFDIQGNKMAYSHIGQHSSCSVSYALESRMATISEYASLLNELKEIGYNNLIVEKGEFSLTTKPN